MTLLRTFVEIQCDWCGASEPVGHSSEKRGSGAAAEARRDANRRGWEHRPEHEAWTGSSWEGGHPNFDLCPPCYAKWLREQMRRVNTYLGDGVHDQGDGLQRGEGA